MAEFLSEKSERKAEGWRAGEGSHRKLAKRERWDTLQRQDLEAKVAKKNNFWWGAVLRNYRLER
jgi:hypothetical protein